MQLFFRSDVSETKEKNKLVIYISQHLKMLYSPFVGYQAGASYHHVT